MMGDTTEKDDSLQCRICFGGEEDGRLFSPCMCVSAHQAACEASGLAHLGLWFWHLLIPPGMNTCRCRGTVRMVHIDCLNSWRNLSTNTDSFFKCDQCGYKYNTERTSWAKVLEEPQLAVAGAITCIFFGTALAGEHTHAAWAWPLPVLGSCYYRRRTVSR